MFKPGWRHCHGIFAAMIAVVMACLPIAGAHATGTGESAGVPINMTIKDAPVAEVLAMLSEASGINIVVGQGVTGTLGSMNLRNVTVEDALKYVALSMGLRWYKEDNGFIVTAQELPAGVVTGAGGMGSAPSPAQPQPGPAVPGSARRAVGGTAVSPAGPELPAAVDRSASAPATPAAGPGVSPAASAPAAQSPVGATVRIAPTVPAGPAVPPTALRGAETPGGMPAAAAGQPQAPASALPSMGRTEPAQSPPAAVGAAVGQPSLSRGLAPVPASRPAVPVTPAAPVAPAVPPAVGAARPAHPPPPAQPPHGVGQTTSSARPAASPTAVAEEAGASTPAPTQPTTHAAQLPEAPTSSEPAGADVHAHRGSGGDRLVEATTRAAAGGDAGIRPTMIPINYASAADIALLLGGTVSRGSVGSAPERRLGRRERRAAEERAGTDAFSALRGAGGMDEHWMQQLDLGGGLGRAAGVGGQTRGGRTGGMGGTQAGMGMGMRPEGVDTIIAYMPQNALLVAGEPAAIDQLREVLSLLDTPVKQVEISTKFIEVDVTQDDAMGIDWMVSNGSLEFFNLGFAPGEAVNNVVRWARGRFEATLGILKTKNRGRIVNEPHIVTQNNMPAYVSFYTSIPYWTATITYNQFGQREVDYEQEEIDVEQTLEVTPRINADDTITMFLMPVMEDQGPDVIGPDGQRLPIIMTQEIETQVTVADGETLALGGMIRKRDTLNERLTPLLSDIPVIGKLFRSRYVTEQHSEMIIFVTPRILREIPPP